MTPRPRPHRTQHRIAALVAAVVLIVAVPLAAGAAEEPVEFDCGEFMGVVCDGYVTDAAGVIADDTRVEQAVARIVEEHGPQIALVIVDESPGGMSAADFAVALGDAWGVGSAERNDGIVVVVDLNERRTETAFGSGISLDGPRIAGAGDSFFAGGDFEGGLLAIAGAIEQQLDDGPGTTVPPSNGGSSGEPDDGGGTGPLGGIVLGLGAVLIGGAAYAATRNSRRTSVKERRAERVDGALERLEASGHELPLVDDYAVPLPADAAPHEAVDTGSALVALRRLTARSDGSPAEPLEALWRIGAIRVIDVERLLTDTAVPLELAASQERPLLEAAVQEAARDALAVDWQDDDAFDVRLAELDRIVGSLRPHRVASTRRLAGKSIADQTVDTAIGAVVVTDLGERIHRAAPVLVTGSPLDQSVEELEAAYRSATDKTRTLERLYDKLPGDTTRPAVAAALADLDEEPDDAYERYEQLRRKLEKDGGALERDGLQIPAIAALLLMNNDTDHVDDFVAAYRAIRADGFEPDEAVEYALAGLQDKATIEAMRREADRLGIPVSITAALLRRRDDGPEVFAGISDELVAAGVTGDTRKTIAGILAVSLEPAQAVRRWLEARQALAALGLEGSYADVAAAFGASDARGPRAFALSYAATRQALARSEKVKDADRFAPELAHEGTSRQTDSWSGRPIPPTWGSFDPFTFFFYHWVITSGHGGRMGWEPVYQDASWAGNRGSWWGGGGGFWSSGGSSWGGGGGFSGGSFGGFGGGGGFSGGGGSGW